MACGTGWSTIVLARAYPKAEVHGLDLDEASIELARVNAANEGVGIQFEARDAADPGCVAAMTWSPASRRCTTWRARSNR